jgi:hypothetical protein
MNGWSTAIKFQRRRSKAVKQGITDQEFIDGLKTLGMKPNAIGDMFGISTSTVKRWLAGVNLPYEAIRKSILGKLQELKQERVLKGRCDGLLACVKE